MKKIFVAHSSSYDFLEKLYKPLRDSELNNQFEIILPQEGGYEVITKGIISDVDLVIAEVSYASTGQGIELGWADISGTPIACIYNEKNGVSSRSLEKISDTFISYVDSDDMIKQLIEFLSKFFS